MISNSDEQQQQQQHQQQQDQQQQHHHQQQQLENLTTVMAPTQGVSPPSVTASIQLRVISAMDGVCQTIHLHPNELTISNVRQHLAVKAPISDQILLIGPPYKVPRDSTFRSEEVLASLKLGDEEDENHLSNFSTTERSGARRLFLFSKRHLSSNNNNDSRSANTDGNSNANNNTEQSRIDLPTCILQPMDIILPTAVTDPSPVSYPSSTPHSPLHQALEVYERQFMLHLCQGRALADGADLRIASCKSCLSEQGAIARALRAAVSNLSYYRNNAVRTRSELTAEIQSNSHRTLLDHFDKTMAALHHIPLHPALVHIAKTNGRMMETLLDTVPVEREKVWATQCRTAHDRLQEVFQEVNAEFEALQDLHKREEEAQEDRSMEESIIALCQELAQISTPITDQHTKQLHQLTIDHQQVVRVVLEALSETNTAGAAISTLENIQTKSSHILPAMKTNDVTLKHLMIKIADHKTLSMRRMKARLNRVSLAQSLIGQTLRRVDFLRAALKQQCEDMTHLEHVMELNTSYRDFLAEIRRRRAYGIAVVSSTKTIMETLSRMRADEVKARERFLKGPGRHLMPAFFELFVPTLATPPPVHRELPCSHVEMDTLPDVGDHIIRSAQQQQGDTDTSNNKPISSGSSSSTIMEYNQPSEDVVSSATEDSSKHGKLNKNNPNETPIQQQQQQQQEVTTTEQQQQALVVSISGGNSRSDETMEVSELETLAHENAVLRQALENAGKSPRILAEEERTSDTVALKAKIAELEKALEQSLDEKMQSASLRDDATRCDKISHSSFELQDVALFMPTGKMSDGRRTYLAFHSNCSHRYLSFDSIQGTPDYVLGRIVFQDNFIAAGPTGSASNPFGLHPGTPYWVLTVEIVKVP